MNAGAAGVGFALGVIIANMHTRAKRRKKRERRQQIIRFHRTVTDEICRWEFEHPRLLLTAPKTGRIIYKGNANKMSIEEFNQKLLEGFKATAAAASQAFERLSNAFTKLC